MDTPLACANSQPYHWGHSGGSSRETLGPESRSWDPGPSSRAQQHWCPQRCAAPSGSNRSCESQTSQKEGGLLRTRPPRTTAPSNSCHTWQGTYPVADPIRTDRQNRSVGRCSGSCKAQSLAATAPCHTCLRSRHRSYRCTRRHRPRSAPRCLLRNHRSRASQSTRSRQVSRPP